MGIYDDLGLCTVINASGTLTRLGGSRMAPETLAAMAEAAASFVHIDELQERAGAVLAKVTGAEAGYVVTTLNRAKTLRPYAEHLITKAKRGGVHQRRQVIATIHDQDVTHKLFAEIGPRYRDRPGGYLRILKLGPRPGDNAPMARVELV